MKKQYKVFNQKRSDYNFQALEDLLNSGWIIERVDSPHITTDGATTYSSSYWVMVYVLSKEENL